MNTPGGGKIDLLSIDVDGNDYHIWEAISCLTPRVVCIEYNGRFPPDCEWVMPYFKEHVWNGNDYFGASLKALEKLGRKKGYQLVGTNLAGVNAFFVRADLAGEKFPEPATAENLYNAPNYTLRHTSGNPNEFFLTGEKYFQPEANPMMPERRTKFENKAKKIDAMGFPSQDMLFEVLQCAMISSDHIVIENALCDYGKAQVILCLIDRYKMFIEYTHIVEEERIWKLYIKLRKPVGEPHGKKYSDLPGAYTESYYLTDCGGYAEFRSSNGVEITSRLKDLYNLIDPAKGERILDVGCGRGELTFALAMAGAKAEGVDYSREAIELAKRTFGKRTENLKYICADIFQLEKLDMFDKIVMADVVEHIEQNVLEKIFAKIAGSLNRSGIFIIHTAPNKDYYEHFYPKLREQALGIGCWKPEEPRSYYEQLMHINEQTPTGLEETLRKYFQHVKVWTGGMRDIDAEKSYEEKCRDCDIFAIACKKREILDKTVRRFTKQPELADCCVEIEASNILMPAGGDGCTVLIKVKNLGSETIMSGKKYPVNLAYHILSREGEMLLFDGERTPVYDEIRPGTQRGVKLRLCIPYGLDSSKEYICRITLVAEGCFWFDQEGGNKTDVSLRIQ